MPDAIGFLILLSAVRTRRGTCAYRRGATHYNRALPSFAMAI